MDTRYVSIHLDEDTAGQLLRTLGYTRDARRRWIAPDGRWYWERDEALTVALRELAGKGEYDA